MSGTLLESPVNGVDKKIPPMSIKKSDDKKKRVTFAEIDADLGQEKDGEESYISQRFMSTDEVFAPVESNYKKIQYRKPSSFKREDSILAPGSSSVVDLNYDDTLRRVSVVVQQHVARGERQKRRDIAKMKRLEAAAIAAPPPLEKSGNGSLNGDRKSVV